MQKKHLDCIPGRDVTKAIHALHLFELRVMIDVTQSLDHPWQIAKVGAVLIYVCALRIGDK
jgi:hypothetical protein